MKQSAINKVTMLFSCTPYLPDLEHSLKQSGFDAKIIRCENIEVIEDKAHE